MSGGHPLAADLDGGNTLRGEAEATSPSVGVLRSSILTVWFFFLVETGGSNDKMRMSGGHSLAAVSGGNTLRGEAEATSPPVDVTVINTPNESARPWRVL